MRPVLLLYLLFFVSSCVTQEKAVRYLSEHKMLADVCADSFPVVNRIDTLIVEVPVVDETTADSLRDEIDEMRAQLEYLRSLPPLIDSTTCKNIVEQYRVAMMRWERRYNELLMRKVPVPQVTYYQTDSAKVKALTEELAKQQQELNTTKADRDKWKQKAQSRGRNVAILAAILVLVLILVGYILGRKFSLKSIIPK